MGGVRDLIRAVRSAKTAADERQVVQKESSQVRFYWVFADVCACVCVCVCEYVCACFG